MSIKFEGVEQFEIGLKKAVDSWEIKAINALNSVLAEMTNYIKVNGPWTDRTSNLRNSISYVPAIQDGDKIVGVIYAGQEYAIYVELKPGFWVISGAFSEYRNKIAKMISDAIKAQND